METVLTAAGGVACAALFGGMLTFPGFFAPMVFAKLPNETATPFMRDIFPRYYIFMTILAALAAVNIAIAQPGEAMVMAAVAAGFLLARYHLMPLTHRLYDAREAGEYGAAEQFVAVHKRSAFLNMAQMVATLVVLIRLML